MAGGAGYGNIVFGGASFVFLKGTIEESGAVVPAVNCTSATDTDEKYTPGDTIDYGTVSTVLIGDKTVIKRWTPTLK